MSKICFGSVPGAGSSTRRDVWTRSRLLMVAEVSRSIVDRKTEVFRRKYGFMTCSDWNEGYSRPLRCAECGSMKLARAGHGRASWALMVGSRSESLNRRLYNWFRVVHIIDNIPGSARIVGIEVAALILRPQASGYGSTGEANTNPYPSKPPTADRRCHHSKVIHMFHD